MKKITSILLIALISISFTGCGFLQKQEYKETVYTALTLMNNNASVLEECSNSLLNVWHNAIYEQKDKSTDKYTIKNGKFVDDFNDALDSLYSDEEFANKLTTINDTQKELRKLKLKLETPPKGAERFNEPLLGMIDSYIEYSNIVLNPQGSYNDVSEQIGKCSNDFVEYASQFEAYEDEIKDFTN